MKFIIALLFVFCYTECRKVYVPINKNANIDFINMEGGGGGRPATQPAGQHTNAVQQGPTPTPAPAPTNNQHNVPTKASPSTTAKPAVQPIPVKPLQPAQPAQITPRPVHPPPATNPITTPGPGSVKQLVNFYDSQGKGSPIRPYSYSQAVKQG